MMSRFTRCCLRTTVPAAILLLASACQTPRRHDPIRDTWVDPDPSVQVIDVAIAKPRLMTERENLLAPVMREAARRVLLDEKGYSVMAPEVVDAAMQGAGLDASADASTASHVVDADAVLLIFITKWDNGYLVPNGRVYASGSIRAAGKPNGRRIFEHTFQDEVLLSPGPVSQLGREEAEKQLAADLVERALASFRKKT